jgi:hypothetical protein
MREKEYEQWKSVCRELLWGNGNSRETRDDFYRCKSSAFIRGSWLRALLVFFNHELHISNCTFLSLIVIIRVFFTLYVNLISINIIFVYRGIYFHSDRIWELKLHVFHSLGSSIIRKMNHLIFKPYYPTLSNIMKRGSTAESNYKSIRVRISDLYDYNYFPFIRTLNCKAINSECRTFISIKKLNLK